MAPPHPRVLVVRLVLALVALGGLGCAQAAEPNAVAVPGLYDGLSKADRKLAAANRQDALERRVSQSGQPWQSANGEASGLVMPIRTFKIKTGHYCREFFEAVSQDGRWRSESATACRNDEGRWITVAP